MTLDDLKFSGQQVFDAWRKSIDLVKPGETDSSDALAVALNRILAEKLIPLLTELEELRKLKEEVEQAPEVFGCINLSNGVISNFGSLPQTPIATHKARLVLIEEVGK